jgi:hypothetical protein
MRREPVDLLATPHLILSRCPHCFTAVPTIDKITTCSAQPANDPRGQAAQLLWHIYICKSCAGIVACATKTHIVRESEQNRVVWIVPSMNIPDQALPGKVRHFLNEARETLNSPSASITMSASAVDAMLKEIDYKAGSLYSRIKKAAEDNRLTPDMELWAHEVRLDANDERHADEAAGLPKIEDARRALDFADTLAQLLFVLPARVRRGLEGKAG